MKKLFLYITLLLSFTSCEKYLEVKPSNILALKTYDDVKSAEFNLQMQQNSD